MKDTATELSDHTITHSVSSDGLTMGTVWAVQVLQSPEQESVGRAVALHSRVTVGRLPSDRVDLVVGDPQLSRVHASIVSCPAGQFWQVEDHGSKNGTFVDGERVRGSRFAPAHAIVRVGETLLAIVPVDFGGVYVENEFGGQSTPLRAALRELDRVAPTDLAVLILGESGAGKELAASRIHGRSQRIGPLVAVNCAAIPPSLAESTLFGHVRGAFTGATGDSPGLIAEAEGGTLFLDEVGELPLDVQPKLLRVLEDHEYRRVGSPKVYRTNARIISATLRDLSTEVAAGAFRVDLLARLQGFRVELPPLRERRADILPLFLRFVSNPAREQPIRLSADFAEALLRYRWPMNVRELRMVAERLMLLHPECSEFKRHHIPATLLGRQHAQIPSATSGQQTGSAAAPGDSAEASDILALVERGRPSKEHLDGLLRQHQGNVAAVAAALGRDRKQIYRWIERFGLDPAQYRDADTGDSTPAR